MGPRNWLGVAFIFLFLPVNIPLWNFLFEAAAPNIRAEFVVPVMFLLGVFLLFYPKKVDSEASISTPDSDNPDNPTDEEE